MSRLDDLIAELCPDGVEFKTLSEVCVISNGKDHKGLAEGSIPVYGSGGVMRYVDASIYKGKSVLIPRKGSLGNLFYLDKPFWTVDTIFYTKINEELIYPKFMYYALASQHLEDLNSAGGVPSLTKTQLDKIEIPVPLLPVQQEIVRILDQFTALEAELEAELEARRKQYEYYRNTLLTFGDDVNLLSLGEVFEMKAGKSIQAIDISSTKSKQFPFQCYGGNGVRGYVKRSSHDGKFVLIGRQGALCGNVIRVSGKFYATEHAVVVTAKPGVNIDWAFHALTNMNLNQYATKSAQPGLSVGTILSLRIPVPPIVEQERLAAILDRFDTLVNDITQGLPAEIAARRKQYEYYRDKLLTFKEKIS